MKEHTRDEDQVLLDVCLTWGELWVNDLGVYGKMIPGQLRAPAHCTGSYIPQVRWDTGVKLEKL